MWAQIGRENNLIESKWVPNIMKGEEPISFSIGTANYFSNIEHTDHIYHHSLVAGVVWHWSTPHINTPQNTAITHKTLIRHKYGHTHQAAGMVVKGNLAGATLNREVAIKRLLGRLSLIHI